MLDAAEAGPGVFVDGHPFAGDGWLLLAGSQLLLAGSLLHDHHGHCCPWLLALCPQSCGKSVNQLVVHLFIPLDQKTGKLKQFPMTIHCRYVGMVAPVVVAGDGRSRAFL